MNLYKKLSKLEDQKESYYYDDEIQLINQKPITNPNNAWNFMNVYFSVAAKNKVLEADDIEKLKNNGKHLHTVSMYFIGILSRDMFKDSIHKTLNSLIMNQNVKPRFPFTYTWFLTCLFHDFSWIHENDEISEISNSDNCFSANVLNKYDIKHEIFNHKLVKDIDFKTHYNKSIIKNYFHYRCKCMKKVDHGIIAGMLLFDRLLKNYDDKWNEINPLGSDQNQTFNCFNFEGRTWRREHQDHFAYIADSIMSHNIWFGTAQDRSTYEKYGLEKLCDSPEKITLDDNPLLFLVGLLDTIEPIKFFNEFSPEYIWQNIDIQFENDSVTITVHESAIFNYLAWFRKIESLKEWLDLRSIDINKRTLIINLRSGCNCS